jgi:outer membrane lipoprotein-sorting protein
MCSSASKENTAHYSSTKAYNPARSRLDPEEKFVNLSRSFAIFGAVAACATVALWPSAGSWAANSVSALVAFDQAFAAITDYTCILHVHEAKGNQTQDRVYQYQFMKPHFAKTLILDGDGKGSGGVWVGTDQVSGHQGGILSGIHMKVSVHDPRAVSLRGVTIPDGLLHVIVDRYGTTPGKLTQQDGGKVAGVPTDRVDLKVADPASNDGVSEQIMYFSKVTHWPVRQILYEGPQIVLDETVADLKTNVGLTQSDFPF